MAAGVIYQTVTTTSGEEVELGFYVDDTVSPTTWIPISLGVNTAGSALATGTGTDGATVPRVTLATNVALPAGTNAIGKLSANSGVDIGDVDVTSVVPGTGATSLGKAISAVVGATDTGVMALAVRQDAQADLGADGDYVPLSVNDSGELRVSGSDLYTSAQALSAGAILTTLPTDQAKLPVHGNTAHDAADSDSPIKVGYKAIAHGTNPTAVAANDRTDAYANRAGVPWVIGGHPNVITRSATIDDADGAQTNAALVDISAGTKIVVTMISATCSSSNSGSVAVRIGFGASVPAASETGTSKVLLEGKFAAGDGHQRGSGAGIVGVGGDGEDLVLTCDDPAGGSLFVTFSYYTVES